VNVLAAVVILVFGFLLHMLPQLTRPGLFFAVTISPGLRESEEGRRILKRYRQILWSSTLAAIAVLLLVGAPLLAMALQAAGYVWAFLLSRQRTLRHAAAPDPILELDLDAPPERLPGGAVISLIPIGALGVLGLWASQHMDRLPARMAVHWGLQGADRWVATTRGTLLGLLAVYALTCLLLAGTAWGLLHASRRIATSGPAARSERRFRRQIALMILLAEYLVIAPAVFALLAPTARVSMIWALAFTALMVGFGVVLLRAGQGGTRTLPSPAAAPTGDHTPDHCWKWGLVYVNPADPSILVEHRFGVGYTLNLGNRWSWVAMMALLALVGSAVVFLR